MNSVEQLHNYLSNRFPNLKIEFDPSETPTGSSFITIPRGCNLPFIIVEYRPESGFGISTPGPDDFGCGVDEVCSGAKATFDRVIELVLLGGLTGE